MFFFRVQIYIDNGWDMSRLKDPNGGIPMEKVVQEHLLLDRHPLKTIIDSPPEDPPKLNSKVKLSFLLAKFYILESRGQKTYQRRAYILNNFTI